MSMDYKAEMGYADYNVILRKVMKSHPEFVLFGDEENIQERKKTTTLKFETPFAKVIVGWGFRQDTNHIAVGLLSLTGSLLYFQDIFFKDLKSLFYEIDEVKKVAEDGYEILALLEPGQGKLRDEIDQFCSLVIYNEKGEVLLHKRDDTPSLPFRGTFATLGGKLEEGETPLEAMKRELKEETDLLLLDLHYEGRFAGVIHVFTSKQQVDIASITLKEGQYLQFFSKETLAKNENNFLMPPLIPLFEQYFAYKDLKLRLKKLKH